MISGGIKFFETSQNLLSGGAIMSATSGDAGAKFALDRNPVTVWRSVDSDDTITETLEVTFMGDKTINRLLLISHNWKEFSVKYDVGGVWTDFASVIGLDGAQSVISETDFDEDTAYYEFAEVTTGKIQIQIVKTQVADQEKYISQIITTSELGTLEGYPKVGGMALDRANRNKRVIGGRYNSEKSDETIGFQLDFQNYPPDLKDDLDLIMSLHDRETPFIVWLCGGRRGTDSFRYTIRGFRLRDAVVMQILDALNPTYNKGVYTIGINNTVKFREHI